MMSKISSIATHYYTENDTRYAFIDGRACAHLQQCYSSLQRQLSLPDYFGRNLDALEEVLADLDWIAEEKIKIIISEIDSLLAKEEDSREDFLEVLNTSGNKRLEIIYLGTE
ncbi:MAG: barstar family protein [Flavitalea sp.]